MTTTARTLTDRYVDAALTRLPSHQRPDIEKELRASIADAIDDQVSAGGDPAKAEVAVLTELGDPERLAAGYADRPLYLIGPALYLDYVRLLKTLLVIVVPVVTAVVALVQVFRGASIGHVVGTTVDVSLTTALHIVVWTTVLFAALERGPTRGRPLTGQWTPAALPEPTIRAIRFPELVAYTVMTVVFSTAVLLSPTISARTDADGAPIGLLSPWLWQTGLVYVFVALVFVSLAASFVRYYLPASAPLVIASASMELSPGIFFLWLATSHGVVNPAYVAAAGWPDGVTRWVNIGVIIVTGLGIFGAATGGVRRFRRR